jgi:ATPase family AAA domain-containing protein 3A/B
MDKLVTLKSKQMQDLESKKSEFEIEKIKAEVDAKAQQERANEDIAIRKLQVRIGELTIFCAHPRMMSFRSQMQSKLDTQQMVEGVKAVSEQISNIIQQFLSRPRQIAAVFGAIAGILFTYNIFCQFIVVLRAIIQSRLGRPALVRETSFSRSVMPEIVKTCALNLYRLIRRFAGFDVGLQSNTDRVLPVIEAAFKDVILESEAKERVVLLAQATRNTKVSQAPYRHVLLHGPPGTGKTLIGR